MTTDRFFAEPVPQDLIAWSWHVVDRQIGRPVEHAQGLGEERHRPATQWPIHRPDRRATNTISTMKMARLNPTIHPMMATSHELAGNRLAHHMAMADANKAKAELAPTAQVLSIGGAISGDNQKTIGTRAIRAKDKLAPNSSALSKPFMKLMVARDGGLVCGIHHKTSGLPQVKLHHPQGDE